MLYLRGFEEKSFYGEAYPPKEHVTVEGLMFRVRTVVEREQAQVTDQIKRNDGRKIMVAEISDGATGRKSPVA